MSGDDRQNSPSISRQNRPSATIDDLLPESFFEVYAAFVFLIETKREVLRTMPGKSTGLHFLFHLLTMY